MKKGKEINCLLYYQRETPLESVMLHPSPSLKNRPPAELEHVRMGSYLDVSKRRDKTEDRAATVVGAGIHGIGLQQRVRVGRGPWKHEESTHRCRAACHGGWSTRGRSAAPDGGRVFLCMDRQAPGSIRQIHNMRLRAPAPYMPDHTPTNTRWNIQWRRR